LTATLYFLKVRLSFLFGLSAVREGDSIRPTLTILSFGPGKRDNREARFAVWKLFKRALCKEIQ
jgi:hypothetical protein